MASTVGTLIKEARTKAGLTQEQLAKTVKIITAADISKAERGEKELTQEALKEIAKATGVTQKSLLDAAKAGSSSKTTTKTSTTKTTSSKTTSTRSTSTQKSTSSTANTSSMKVTATEKKLVELYRAADSDTKKAAMNLLKGKEEGGDLSELLGSLVKSFTGGDAAKTTSKSTKKDDSSDLMGTLMNALKTLK